MNFNDLLHKQNIDPAQVIVMRHSPKEKEMKKVMPWLVHEKPEVFNAYQQSQSGLVENALNQFVGTGYLAAFIGLKPGTAVFAGLYRIRGAEPLDHKQFWSMEVNKSLRSREFPFQYPADRGPRFDQRGSRRHRKCLEKPTSYARSLWLEQQLAEIRIRIDLARVGE